ncbi:MAG: hypothetical protein ABI743_12625, partial [bacterium]
FQLSHEFTHLLHGHFDFLQQESWGRFTKADALRGLESDADDGATAIAMLLLQRGIERALLRGEQADPALGWLRLAYAVTMLFAIMDVHRQYFGKYAIGSYNHPMVRCELFFFSVERCLDANPAMAATWQANSTEGWRKCVAALEDLTLDAHTGKFGEIPKNVLPRKLHNMNYSATPMGVTDMHTFDLSQEAVALMREVRALLPLFQSR